MEIALIMMSITVACLLVLCGSLLMMLQEMKMKVRFLKLMAPSVTVTKEISGDAEGTVANNGILQKKEQTIIK